MKKKIYCVDITINFKAYVAAEDGKEARGKAEKLEFLEVEEKYVEDVEINPETNWYHIRRLKEDYPEETEEVEVKNRGGIR